MGLNANALFTVEEARGYLGVDDVTKELAIERLANGVSQAVADYTARTLVNTTYTNEYYDGPGERWLLLREWPVTALSAVSYMTDEAGTVWESIASGDWLVDPQSRRLAVFRTTLLPWGRLNVKVTYTAGYTTYPSALVEGAKLWLAELYRKWDKQLEGVSSVNLGGQSVQVYIDGPSRAVRTMLDPYRRLEL